MDRRREVAELEVRGELGEATASRGTLPVLEKWSDERCEDGGNDAVRADGDSRKCGGEGVLRNDTGGTNAAACSASGEATRGGIVDIHPVESAVDADGHEHSTENGKDGAERWHAANILRHGEGNGCGQ